MQKPGTEHQKNTQDSYQTKFYAALREHLFQELSHADARDGKELPAKIAAELRAAALAMGLESVNATDIYAVEATTLDYLSDQELRLRIGAYRGMLLNLLTEESYAVLSPQFAKIEDAQRNILLDEARGMASRLYRRYLLVPQVEKLKSRIVKRLFLGVGFAYVLMLISYFVFSSYGFVPDRVFMFAGCAGAAGAAVSTADRLNRLDPRHEPLLTWLNLINGEQSLWISPALGALFAIIFLLLMKANLFSGTLFPQNLSGLPPADLARLLIWCFLAGWAERLVPDVLNKLSAQPVTHVRFR
jgi:hypothetical protein